MASAQALIMKLQVAAVKSCDFGNIYIFKKTINETLTHFKTSANQKEVPEFLRNYTFDFSPYLSSLNSSSLLLPPVLTYLKHF